MKIKSIYVNNYRSLVNFEVKTFDDTVIFYGENNAGKSNVLNFLNLVFQRKRKKPGEAKQNFYEGIIENFSNNFYKNTKCDIDFIVEVKANKEEIFLSPVIKKQIKLSLENIFKITGKIVASENDSANISVNEIKLNKDVIFSFNEEIKYFPNLKGKAIEDGILSGVFTKLMDPLNDCISIISSNRDMHPVSFLNPHTDIIEPDSFKNFMHSLYLSKEKHDLFEKINEVFNRPPFSFGEISFSRENEFLELMIKDNGIRLPIKHLGSGVLQSLYIIASIVYFKHKIICIEELEQNLSPSRQNATLRMIQSMLNDEKIGDLQQIILSSHSPVFSSAKLGLIYLLDKLDGTTIIKETRTKKLDLKDFPHMKKYFRDTMHPLESYTKEEMEERVAENIKLGKELLDR